MRTILASLTSFASRRLSAPPVRVEQTAARSAATIAADLHSLLSTPLEYETSRDAYPLIVWLHRSDQDGSEVETVRPSGVPAKIEGGRNVRKEFSTTYYPRDEVAAGVARWPALEIVKGTWDSVEGLDRSLRALNRATGSKDIVVFHGPHQLAAQPPENMELADERMATFALAAARGEITMDGGAEPSDLRALVLSAPPDWDMTPQPDGAP